MNCPTCGKELRTVQVETMIGNPEFNEWSRSGYCSFKCFDEKDPSDKPVEIQERTQTTENLKEERKLIPASKPREFDSYTLATACLLAVPFAMLIGAIGRFAGVYMYPQAALAFFSLLCLILLAGLASGGIALMGIRKHGREGILWKSMIGILLILGYTALAVTGTINDRSKKSEAEQGVGLDAG